MTAAEKLRLARQLDRAGRRHHRGRLPDCLRRRLRRGARRSPARCAGRSIAGLARAVHAPTSSAPRPRSSAAARPRIHVFLATSDLHLRDKLRIDRARCLEQAAEAVRARAHVSSTMWSSRPRTRRAATWRSSCDVAEAVVDAGATTREPARHGRLRAARRHHAHVHAPSRRASAPASTLSAHCHDDLGMAVANSLAAMQAGARQVECTINGIGERAGNASLEEIVMALHVRRDRLPFDTGDPHDRAVRDEPAAERHRRRAGAAQQGHRRRQRVRARGRHPSGRRAEEPADLRDPPAGDRRRARHAARARQALGHARCRCALPRARLLPQPEALARVYARLVTTADTVKTIEDVHIIAGGRRADQAVGAGAATVRLNDRRAAGRRHRPGSHRRRPVARAATLVADACGHDVRLSTSTPSAARRSRSAARALPDATLRRLPRQPTRCCSARSAIPRSISSPPGERPEVGTAAACGRALGGFANLRPARTDPALDRRHAVSRRSASRAPTC